MSCVDKLGCLHPLMDLTPVCHQILNIIAWTEPRNLYNSHLSPTAIMVSMDLSLRFETDLEVEINLIVFLHHTIKNIAPQWNIS